MIELEVISGAGMGQHIKTNAPFVSIGRSPEHTIVVEDAFVSRHHGEILLLESGYQYRDLNSTHGTILRRDGAQEFVKQASLREGDELIFGSTDNTLRVVQVITEDSDSPNKGITMFHLKEDRFGPPEVMFANDSKALRTLVEFDSRIMDANVTKRREILDILLEYIPRLFERLEYVAIIHSLEQGLISDSFKLINPGAIVRLSTHVIEKSIEGGQRGIAYQIENERRLLTDKESVALSDASAVVKGAHSVGVSGICVPIQDMKEGVMVLQFERASTAGAFRDEDVGLVAAMAARAGGRLRNLELVEQNQRLNLNASLGVFAGMIGHDIKNYLFYSKRLSEIRDDTLGQHPGLAKGIERSRKLAQGMKDLAAPGKATLKIFSIEKLVSSIAEEFNSLFSEHCNFDAVLEQDMGPLQTSEDLLSRVIWNLVMNAYHACENRPARLKREAEVTIQAGELGTEKIFVEVKDNAGGVGPKTLEYMSRSFELIHLAYKHEEDLMDVVHEISTMEGFTNSIGLFFTAVAANDLHGTITAETDPGEGSRFRIEIPVKVEELRNLLRF